MHRPISRRDLLHGVGAMAASSLLPGTLIADERLARALRTSNVYPPALTGLRGSHAGSFEVAHRLAREAWRDWGPVAETDPCVYDLVVVGAGISGLAAAYFFQQKHPDARILILDNHDDFGGHAKRNEFRVAGRTLIGYGGSQTLEEPASYSSIPKKLLHDLGIKLDRFQTAYDRQFYRRNGLRGAVFFNREDWGSDRLVSYDLGGLRYTLPLSEQRSAEAAVGEMPMSDAAREQLLRLLTTTQNLLEDVPAGEREDYLESISYRTFLSEHAGITEPQVFAALQDLTTDLGGGIESAPALDAMVYIGLPGYAATGLPDFGDGEPYIHHFPDGNATIARLLVRILVPGAMDGTTMDDIVFARCDYSNLDASDSPVRLRLNSTVVNAAQVHASNSIGPVTVSYVRNGRLGEIRAKHCVLACYNAMIPAICPDMPDEQRKALSMSLKIPILYTNVALRNWQAWKKLGVGAISAPGSYHVNAMLDFPVDMGGYEHSDEPDEPVIVHMERFPHRSGKGLSLRQQSPLGRLELLTTSFEDIERHIRAQLAAMLSAGGFDPARDIVGITANRWPHGYATRDWLEDPYYEDPDDSRYSHVRGRQRFGRITIANSDAAANATYDAAVLQAYRAVNELV